MQGSVILPGNEAYGRVREISNYAVKHQPALFAMCETVQDVQAAVDTAREYNIRLSVRGGGHDWAGRALCDAGLVVDLSRMRRVEVDTKARVATVEGGATAGDLIGATEVHGLIAATGMAGVVGVAGLTLGGGYGPLTPRCGLALDNLLGAEVVLADGRLVKADVSENPDLFWALRGGGGNFGIVTRFTMAAHDFGPMMRIGVSVYEPEQAAAALRGYAAMVPTLPRSVGWHAALKHDMPALPFVPPEYVGKRLVMLVSMWLEDADDDLGAEMIGRLTEIGEPCIKATTVLPFAAGVQRLIDTEFEDGHRYYTKEAHVADLADEAIDKLVTFWQDMPMEGEVEIIGLGGAIGDVPEAGSAFSNRGYLLWLNFAMRWDDPADDPDYIGRTRAIVADLAPWTGRGVYYNMLNFDELDRVVEALGGPEKYAELGRLKARYDPENLFRMNYNIPPAPGN
jgi:FAD/FMN-containing dehydrogenase